MFSKGLKKERVSIPLITYTSENSMMWHVFIAWSLFKTHFASFLISIVLNLPDNILHLLGATCNHRSSYISLHDGT